MKKAVPFFVLAAITILFQNCGLNKGVSKNYTGYGNIFDGNETFKSGMDTSLGYFIELENGQQIKGKHIEPVVKNLGKKFIVDGVDYPYEKVVKFQYENGYFSRYKGVLVPRLTNNRISLYRYYLNEIERNGLANTYEKKTKVYYLIEKDGVKKDLYINTLKKFVADAEDAKNTLNKVARKMRSLQLAKWGLGALGSVSAFFAIKEIVETDKDTNNPRNNTKLYGGAAGVVTSLVGNYIIVKKQRENISRLVEVIDDYNWEMRKKK